MTIPANVMGRSLSGESLQTWRIRRIRRWYGTVPNSFASYFLHLSSLFLKPWGDSTPMMATSPRRNFSSQTIPPPPGDPSKNPYPTSKAESISEISLICTFCSLHRLFQSHRMGQNSFQLLQLRRLGYEMRKGPPGEFHPEVDIVFLRHPALGVQIMVLHHLVLQFPSISSIR